MPKRNRTPWPGRRPRPVRQRSRPARGSGRDPAPGAALAGAAAVVTLAWWAGTPTASTCRRRCAGMSACSATCWARCCASRAARACSTTWSGCGAPSSPRGIARATAGGTGIREACRGSAPRDQRAGRRLATGPGRGRRARVHRVLPPGQPGRGAPADPHAARAGHRRPAGPRVAGRRGGERPRRARVRAGRPGWSPGCACIRCSPPIPPRPAAGRSPRRCDGSARC